MPSALRSSRTCSARKDICPTNITAISLSSYRSSLFPYSIRHGIPSVLHMLLLLDNEVQSDTEIYCKAHHIRHLPRFFGDRIERFGIDDKNDKSKDSLMCLRHFQQDLRGLLRSQPADSEDRHHESSGQALSVRKDEYTAKTGFIPPASKSCCKCHHVCSSAIPTSKNLSGNSFANLESRFHLPSLQ